MSMIRSVKVFILCMVILAIPAKAFCRNELLIGLIPEENIFDQVKKHKRLAEYLSGKLGVKVRLTILSRYGDIIDKFKSRRMDGAFFGDITGFVAMDKLGVEPAARLVTLAGKSTIQGYIFVRKDSGIKTVRDMKGKRIAFVDPLTATGYLYAVSFFKEKGIHDLHGYFKEQYFTGSHDSVIYSVLDNRADVGCAEDSVYENMVEKDPSIRAELTILAASKDFPSSTLFLRKNMPAQMKAGIRNALMHMGDDAEGRMVLAKMKALRFADARKRDFATVKELIRDTGFGMKSYRAEGASESR